MLLIALFLVVPQISCNTSTPIVSCDGTLCVNDTSKVILPEKFDNSSLMYRIASNPQINSSNAHQIVANNDQISPLISESEFMNTSQCWKKLYFSAVNLTETDYQYFASFLNKYRDIKNRTEVAMLLTHIYRQTRGFDRSQNWCAFKSCVIKNETDTIVNYFGRGYIHLYGEQNYKSASYELFGSDVLVKNPDLVATNQTIAWKTAFWFWMKYAHAAATSDFFGATIPMIWGEQTCNDPKNQGSFETLFQLYVCILETINIDETAGRDGCAVLSMLTAVSNTNPGNGVAIYIIAPISAVIFFIAIIAIIFYIRHRTAKNQFGVSFINPFEMTEKNLEDIGFKPSYEFPLNRLIMKEELGFGFFGAVYKAKAIGLHSSEGDVATVAVKKVKEKFDTAHQAALLSELKIFLSIGKHLNIINFLGAVTKGELMLIFEFCEFGNLREYLLEHRDCFVNQLDPDTLEYNKSIKAEKFELTDDVELKTYELICYSYQISQGMEYLASRSILHRDLAARNVLLTKGKIVKLCDFGLAKDVYHYGDYCTTSNKLMPVKWMSIESVRDRVYTVKSDVWAFGVVLWEIFSLGCEPYPGVQIDEQFLNKIVNGYRMERPEYCPKAVHILMNACWEYEPKNRPNFEALTFGLRNILDESTRHYYLQLNDNYVKLSTNQDFNANNYYTNIAYTFNEDNNQV